MDKRFVRKMNRVLNILGKLLEHCDEDARAEIEEELAENRKILDMMEAAMKDKGKA